MGEYAEYYNTPQTAADMNSTLDALGQEYMFYWGFSYDTLLGQTYAGLFPEGFFDSESLADTDKVLDGFFDECIKAGANNCSLSSLAASQEDLRNIVLSYMDKLREQPVSVYINNTVYGLLDYDKVWFNGVLPALYKPSTWTALADNLYKLIQGNATDAFLVYGGAEAWEAHDELNEFITLNDGITGPDHWL
ncbi:hypothetical protein BDV29DRAFT_161920 [Aspergillus leporis]|uniref:Uncharacterized protein n=1 Tax=Aspergillus leporis TaxID=41062 RepID=A0A5N5WMM3_9EURO|nr:hypothetical protein BDV29DRAFT_161920 [Aspergillus leporis]